MLDAESMNKPGKKGKELQVLDGKAGQNLCKLLYKQFSVSASLSFLF